jgi:hypothetical protein
VGKRWFVLVLLAGCERKEPPTPTCEAIADHAVANMRAANALQHDVKRMLRVPPWDGTLGPADRAFILNQCAGWEPAYRRCIIEVRGEPRGCGEHDYDWYSTPTAKAWMTRLQDLAYEAYRTANHARDHAEDEVERLETALRDAKATDRTRLVTELATARKTHAAAAVLAKDCEASPLEKASCVALLPK